jgi:hypothetical protein
VQHGLLLMTAPKLQPCPKCGNIYVEMYGYGDWGATWHVECDECHYLGPGGSKLQAIREHNATTQKGSDNA